MQAWRWMAGLAVVAVGVHLYGLYRVGGPPTSPWFPHADKVEHVVGFGLPLLLVLLAHRLWRQSRGQVPSRGWLVVVVVVFLAHAVVSEIIQHVFYTWRTGDPFDALADWSGVGLGLLAYGSVARVLGRPGRP